ncbi:hypothetical protein KIN20_004132 [Parelaphostrongylus tenuis]|uniref:Uncharacterized protein n=1 Tax=Parelaphostrongylus tenuis TaxID=148309 RepID=A0AAD5MQW9_PARTN|nr:hypothetical protein KIN20_004132 [Parelaphostrongylus tenuis]
MDEGRRGCERSLCDATAMPEALARTTFDFVPYSRAAWKKLEHCRVEAIFCLETMFPLSFGNILQARRQDVRSAEEVCDE